jgi:hypothetical protein
MAAAYGGWIVLDCAPPRSVSMPTYFGMIVTVGILGLIAESFSGAILERDKSTDPLATRAGRLLLLFLVCGPIVGAIFWVLSKM